MSATWILILTISMINGPPIEQVVGFATDSACKAAGQAWVNSLKASYSERASFVCVNTGLKL